MFVSRDEMRTWEPIPLGGGVASGQPIVAQLERDPANQGAFYAAGPAVLYRSDDQGVTWTAKMAGLPADAEMREIFVMR
ncbi:MAG: exo-alpha-sialidase, partial [Acidobacteria bacterium]|nr:exo-alpha-sialidase [Acidobacteriota bacterium]